MTHHKDQLPVPYVTRAKRGRPYTYDRAELVDMLNAYIEQTTIPIVAEFAYFAGMHRQGVYAMPELADGLKRLITKKEAMLERMAMTGQIDKTMAIFSLKQIGWSDQPKLANGEDETSRTIVVRGGLPD